ncbi:MAG: hypothetical protein DRJ68_01310 [Thermoprotei archaeon]|nr:MAG: hypothetical protein DRJ68_01310 [Thermoprotei archaeon]
MVLLSVLGIDFRRWARGLASLLYEFSKACEGVSGNSGVEGVEELIQVLRVDCLRCAEVLRVFLHVDYTDDYRLYVDSIGEGLVRSAVGALDKLSRLRVGGEEFRDALLDLKSFTKQVEVVVELFSKILDPPASPALRSIAALFRFHQELIDELLKGGSPLKSELKV